MWSLIGWSRLLKSSYRGFDTDLASRMAAALASYTVLSLAPLLILIITVAGFVFGRDVVQSQLVGQVTDLIGTEGGIAVAGMIKGASQAKGTGVFASILGLITLLWGATNVVNELRADLNTIWGVADRETGILQVVKQRSYLVGVVVAAGFLLLVSLAVSAAVAAAGKFVGDLLPIPEFVLHALNFVLSMAVITVLFAAMFRMLPKVNLTWHDVMLGRAFTALLFTIGKPLIGLYLGKASFGSTFGAAGSVVIILVWVYYSAQIFLFGVRFTRVYAEEYGSREPKKQQVRGTGTPADVGSMSTTATSGNAALPPMVHRERKPEEDTPRR